MVITVIGWYGTETIGDRAILAGILSFFGKTYKNFSIQLGSLYPFFSNRTVAEDLSFFRSIANVDFDIDVFNSKDTSSLETAIRSSDLVAIGGGPLMHIDELFMLEYAFSYAKRKKVKTAILGCGVGPLFTKVHQKSVLQIARKSDIIILRDNQSLENLNEIYSKFGKKNKSKVLVSYDPAVECAIFYDKNFQLQDHKEKSKYVSINLRSFPQNYARSNVNIYEELKYFIKDIFEQYPDFQVKLIPMHYFHIGDDDRFFLNKIKNQLSEDRIEVQNEPLSLEGTMYNFKNAEFNIGMRYHSVVLQTILNGKNYILDYTEPRKGKISGFINDIDKNNFYTNRYLSLQEDRINSSIIKNVSQQFIYCKEEVSNEMMVYKNELSF